MKTRINLIVLLGILFMSPSFVTADGNITATVTGGNLRIVGERTARQGFMMTPTAIANQYLLRGFEKGTINGVEEFLVVGVTNDVEVNMYSHESAVILSNGSQESLPINGSLKINANSRDCAGIILDSVFCYQNMFLSTGSGHDAIVAAECTFKWGTDIRTGNGKDVCLSYFTATQKMQIDGGPDDDILMTSNNLFTRNTIIRGASGADLLASVGPYSSEVFEFDGGAGTDKYVFGGLPGTLTARRMEGVFPGTFENVFDLAMTHDCFYGAVVVYALLP